MTDQKESLVSEYGQFTIVPNRLVHIAPIIGLDAFNIWVMLQYHSGDKPTVYPSYDRLQAMTGLTRARVSAAIKVLVEFGLVTKHKRFGKTTEYRIIIITAEKLQEILAQYGDPWQRKEHKESSSSGGKLLSDYSVVQQVDSSSSDGQLPVVQQVNLNQTQLTRLIEPDSKESAETGAEVVNGIDHQAEALVKNPRALAALAGHEARRTQAEGQGLSLEHLGDYPEGVRPFLERFHKLWFIPIPSYSRAKGSQSMDWLKSARAMINTQGFALDILDQVRQDQITGKITFDVYRPGSLIRVVSKYIGDRAAASQPQAAATGKALLDAHLKAREQQQQENERRLAEARLAQARAKQHSAV